MPRFDQSFTGICEQNLQETLQLKQRYLDTKAKRAPKTKDKKQQDSIQSSVHVQQKFLKRPADDHDQGNGPNDNFEPPVKLQCTTQNHGTHQNEGLTKFSVEIVQQLEFTTSAANSQPQQISANVTVKAHANASVKSDVSSPKSNPATPASNLQQKSNIGLETLVECVKQEPDNDFADLDQCAAALDRDAAANGGAAFGNLSDLIGDDTNDEIMSAAAFKDLISDISSYPDYPDLMKFDFEDKTDTNSNGLKAEDIKDLPSSLTDNTKNTHSPLLANQNNYSPPVFDGQNINKNRMPPYSNMDFSKTELSPAAQTLKQMAEQHQHKNQMGLSFNPNNRVPPNPRSPYTDFQFQGDYGSPNSNSNFHKNSPNFPQPDMIKQEMIFQSNEFDMKRKSTGMYKQQYSPYSSPSASSHGSPGYLPRSGTASNTAPSASAFGGGTPPRPSSGPGGNNSTSTLQINQAQQLNISQQSHGHSIQVSAGQHLHLSGELKGNVSIAAQQGMHFSQHVTSNNAPSAQNAQNNSQQSPLSQSQSHQSQSMHNNMNNQHGPTLSQTQSGPQLSSTMMSGGQQIPNPNQQNQMGGGMQNQGMSANNMQSGMSGGIMTGPGPMQHAGALSGNLGGQHTDSYSMSQTQTINFTQQSLRRANGPGGVPNSMAPNVPMGPNGPMVPNGPMGSNVQMGPNNPMGPNGPMGSGPMGGQGNRLLEQQKMLHQQQMIRVQQQAAMQQMVRPPPPDYKTTAGMMQNVQPRYAAAAPPNMRRMPHQTMPPSGPMIRPNMYMLQQQQQQQQQHLSSRNMYPRQQNPMSNMETLQHGSSEWRHLMMTQQQSTNFNNIRPNFQQGFNINSNNIQMNPMQHQQMRTQQGMVPTNMGNNQQNMTPAMAQSQMISHTGGPMAQMNNMSQTMFSPLQQQQNLMQQNAQMAMTNIHMQQSQSITVTNQNMQQQQQNLSNQLTGTNNTNSQSNTLSNFNSQSDFNFEFLDNLQTTDSTSFTDQELLNSFDTESGFNLDF